MRVALLVLLLAFVLPVSAHVNGQSFEEVVGEYTVDVGYDSFGAIESGDSVRFDLSLSNKDKTEPMPFGGVWVQLLGPDKRVLFAGEIRNPDIGKSGFSYRFLKSGSYTLSVRYEKAGDDLITLAEAAFPFSVVNGREGGTPSMALQVGSGIIIGAAISYILLRRKRI